MKHFLLEEEHNASFKRPTSELIAAHRRFLQQGYHEGLFLLSGPTIPPASEILIARAKSLEALSEFLEDKRYCKSNLMQFNRIIEFEPIQHQFLLNNWFEKYSG